MVCNSLGRSSTREGRNEHGVEEGRALGKSRERMKEAAPGSRLLLPGLVTGRGRGAMRAAGRARQAVSRQTRLLEAWLHNHNHTTDKGPGACNAHAPRASSHPFYPSPAKGALALTHDPLPPKVSSIRSTLIWQAPPPQSGQVRETRLALTSPLDFKQLQGLPVPVY